MTEYSKKNREIIRESAFDKKKKKPELNFNPGLELPLSVTRRSIEQLGPGLYRELREL